MDSRVGAALGFSEASTISTSLSSSLEPESESEESPDLAFFTEATGGLPLTAFAVGAGFVFSSELDSELSLESSSELSFESSLDAGGGGGGTLFEWIGLAISVATESSSEEGEEEEEEEEEFAFFLPFPAGAALTCDALGLSSSSDSLSEDEDESEPLDSFLAGGGAAFVGAAFALAFYECVRSDEQKNVEINSPKDLCELRRVQGLYLTTPYSRNLARSPNRLNRRIPPCWARR